MKYLKTFENIKEPQIGDYVICSEYDPGSSRTELENFLSNNIGQIINKHPAHYYVKYKHVPKKLKLSFH